MLFRSRLPQAVAAGLLLSGLVALLSSCRLVSQRSQTSVKEVDQKTSEPALAGAVAPAGHGMLVFGQKTLYMYQLPLWVGAHAWQLVLEIGLDADGQKLYEQDVKAGATLSTFDAVPFALAQIKPGMSFKGSLYHGHYEQGGAPLPLGAKPAEVTATVRRVLLVKALDPTDEAFALPHYFVFGSGSEWYGVHLASRPPDFDQIFQVAETTQLNTLDLAAGVNVILPQTKPGFRDRPLPGAKVLAATGPQQQLSLKVGREIYATISDLGVNRSH